MKYYSEILKKNFDTAEACEEAEAKIQNQFVKKEAEKAVTENNSISSNSISVYRKEAAAKVEEAFAKASQIRKSNKDKRALICEELTKINDKYNEQIKAIEEERKKEKRELELQYKDLDKEDRQSLEEAYEILRDFCKKYGAYHYSVNAEGADLFPMLLGFGQMEKANNMFNSMFGDFFNLF